MNNGRKDNRTEMPLFNKEFERAEFDRKVQENPLNDHLRVKVLPVAEKADIGENITQSDTKIEQKTGYEDAFFINREQETVTWMYFNSDSSAGGQYVTNTLSFDEIRNAAQNYKSADELDNLNDRMCRELGLYYDSNYNLVIKKDNSK